MPPWYEMGYEKKLVQGYKIYIENKGTINNIQADKQKVKQSENRQSNKQSNNQTDKQTDRQTDRLTA